MSRLSKPVVAIVGRPNVGKSTLFNRLVGHRISIVDDDPSITRDRIYANADWLGREFLVVDTGGIELNAEAELKEQMKYQAQVAVGEADVIVLVVNVRDGLTPHDREVANFLRQADKPIVLAANKAENLEQAEESKYDFYQLGFTEPYLISAYHGRGIGDLLDEISSHFPPEEESDYQEETIKFSVAGRPNVGKSTFVNQILGEERVIVNDEAGTTRDAIDTPLVREEQEYVIIDTAGMRRKSKVDPGVEKYSVIRSLRAVDRSDVVLVMLDATEGITNQDKKIAGYADEEGKGIVLVVNKWDLVDAGPHTVDRYTEEIRYRAEFLAYAPIIFTSALHGQRVFKTLDLVDHVAEQNKKEVKENVLNELIKEAVDMVQPPANKRGKRLKIYSAYQSRTEPPTFVLRVNDPELMNFSYRRYVKNQLRKSFGFEGAPIKVNAQKK